MAVPRIISISRRGDIPAFQTSWLMNRLREGYCHFQTPYGGKILQVSLKPEDCDGLVFWTRNPFPLFKYIDELKDRGYYFYFHFTITGYPKPLESHTPHLLKSIERFISLSEKIGTEAVHWRYDPVVLSSLTPEAFHIDNFSFIADKLKGRTGICTASFIQFYEKSRDNFAKITKWQGHNQMGCRPDAQQKLCQKKKILQVGNTEWQGHNQMGYRPDAQQKLCQKKKISQVSNTEQHGVWFDEPSLERKLKLAKTLKGIATENEIKLRSCCDNTLLSAGIPKGSCVGPEYLSLVKRQVAATKWSYRSSKQTENSSPKKKLLQCNIIKTDSYGNWKKKPTRKGCACFESVDIGTYETCTFGCCYCYATRSRESALKHLKNYDKNDSILIRPKKYMGANLSCWFEVVR